MDVLNAFYGSVAGVLFNKSLTTLIQCPARKAGSYTIPNSVTSIGGYAFLDCWDLLNVTIGNSVTSIGQAAFYNCTSLSSITLPNNVTSIGNYAFSDCRGLTSVTIPNSVRSIGYGAFQYCPSLTRFYFQGNALSGGNVNDPPLSSAIGAVVYYLPGTTGWGPTFRHHPTALWNPQAQTSDASFGVRTNRFGFNITGSSGLVIVVEACTNLAGPIWSAVGTNTLTGGSSYFSDPQWADYPGRFYRLRSP